jgi:hypothetical protein
VIPCSIRRLWHFHEYFTRTVGVDQFQDHADAVLLWMDPFTFCFHLTIRFGRVRHNSRTCGIDKPGIQSTEEFGYWIKSANREGGFNLLENGQFPSQIPKYRLLLRYWQFSSQILNGFLVISWPLWLRHNAYFAFKAPQSPLISDLTSSGSLKSVNFVNIGEFEFSGHIWIYSSATAPVSSMLSRCIWNFAIFFTVLVYA